MRIVCPHCATSYAVKAETLGGAGRTVRCSRCKETWLARPEDAIEEAMATAPAAAGDDRNARDPVAAEWDAFGTEPPATQPPVVESPSIAAGFEPDPGADGQEWDDTPLTDAPETATRSGRLAWLGRLLPRRSKRAGKAARRQPAKPSARLQMACAAMAAMVAGLVFWRTDVVRLLPQTATFYKSIGLGVNLRGLGFRDVKISTETVDGKPVLVIEGSIVGESRKSVDQVLPRLRFSVRDGHGVEIYAWNTVLEQTVLKPGERVQFKTRLASPPAEGHSIDVRFFNKRDIASGSA